MNFARTGTSSIKHETALRPGHKVLIAITIIISLIAIGLLVAIIVLATAAPPPPLAATAPLIATSTTATTATPATTKRPVPVAPFHLPIRRAPAAPAKPTTPIVTAGPIPPIKTPTTRPTTGTAGTAAPTAYQVQGCDDGVSPQPHLTCPPNKGISGGNIQYGQWNVADFGGVSCGSPTPAPHFVTAGMPVGAIGQSDYQLGPITSYSYNPNPSLPAKGVSNQYLVKYQCS